jgi:hypothetical protein
MAVLSMSKQEFSRLDVLLRVQSGRLHVADACALMGLHRRQVFRLLRGLRQDGAPSLLSKRRGKPSNHRLPPEVRTLALSIVRERYADFGPTFAAVMPFRTPVFAARGCHLYFARRVTFLSCADRRHVALADRSAHRHAFGMFIITETDAAAIRAVYEQEGELSAAIELRRLFPGIIDNAKARTRERRPRPRPRNA